METGHHGAERDVQDLSGIGVAEVTDVDEHELAALCRGAFGEVEVRGLFGSERYLAIVARERRRLDRLLRVRPVRAAR